MIDLPLFEGRHRTLQARLDALGPAFENIGARGESGDIDEAGREAVRQSAASGVSRLLVHQEFGGNFEVYAAYRKAEENGLIGVGPKTTKKTVEAIPPLPRHFAPHQIEQAIQSRWNNSTALRQEFAGNYEPFRAYCIAHSQGLCA